MLDLNVLVLAMRYAAVTSTEADARAACLAEVTSFDGVEVAAMVTGRTGATRAEVFAGAEPLSVVAALARRAALVVNSAGRIGVVVSAGRVLQPAGRQYALTDSTPQSWETGWWPNGVTSTLAVVSW